MQPLAITTASSPLRSKCTNDTTIQVITQLVCLIILYILVYDNTLGYLRAKNCKLN